MFPPPGRSDLGAFLSRQAPPGVVGLAFSLRVYNPPKLPRSTLLNRSLPHPQRDGVTQSFKGLSGRFIVGGAHPTSGKTNKGNRSGSRLLAVTCQVPLRPRLTSAPPPQSATQKMATDRMLPFYAQDATGAASSSTFSYACVRCATPPLLSLLLSQVGFSIPISHSDLAQTCDEALKIQCKHRLVEIEAGWRCWNSFGCIFCRLLRSGSGPECETHRIVRWILFFTTEAK